MTPLLEAVEEYLLLREARGAAQKTIISRRRALCGFVRYAARRGVCSAGSVTAEVVCGYARYLKGYRTRAGAAYAENTLSGIYSSVRGFFAHLYARGGILTNPADFLRLKRRPRPASGVIAEAAVERVLARPDTGTPEGLRDRAILEVFYSTGIRRAELASLGTADINPDTGTLFVRQGKGKKDRLIPVGERALFWVRRYAEEVRSSLLFTPSGRARPDPGVLFLHHFGGKMKESTLTHLAGKYVRAAGIERGACHALRHALASHMVWNGADVRYVQEILGHSSPETTEIYTHIPARRLKETHNRTHPAAFAQAVREQGAAVVVRRPVRRPLVHRAQTLTVGAETEIERLIREFRTARFDLSEGTLSFHAQNLAYLRCFLEARRIRRAREITSDVLEDYQKEVAQSGLKTSTQRHRLSTIRSFTAHLVHRGVLLTDPAARIVLPKLPQRLPARILSADEADKVLSVPDTGTAAGLRNRAVLEVLYGTGMRAGELAGLTTNDPDFERGLFFVRALKSGKDRMVPPGRSALYWTARYLDEVRPFYDTGASGVLFLSETGGALVRNSVTRIAGECMRRAGIKDPGSAHVFRHTCATLMLENGADLRSVQEMLGHRSIGNTAVYTRLSIRRLKEVHAATHPAEKRFLQRIKRDEEERAGEALPGKEEPA